jgi:hypothetical protein
VDLDSIDLPPLLDRSVAVAGCGEVGTVGNNGEWELWVDHGGCYLRAMVMNGAAASHGEPVAILAGVDDVDGIVLTLPDAPTYEPIMEVPDERYEEIVIGLGRQQWYLEHARTDADREAIQRSMDLTRRAYSVHEDIDTVPPDDEEAALDALDAHYRDIGVGADGG